MSLHLAFSRQSPLFALLLLMAVLVAACSRSGPVRRISEPSASIQQLTVGVDGQWSLELRLHNFSSIPMQFDAVSLTVQVGAEDAGQLDAAPMLTIGPESADVVTVSMQPPSAARIAIASALASGQGISYRITGTVDARPHDRDKPRRYDLQHASTLNPAPGLPGVLR